MTDFWDHAARLKTVERKGWKRLRLRRVESVADHSYALAMLVLFEGEKRNYDVETLLKLALIHDLEESIIGDLTPEDKRRMGPAKVRQLRSRAITTLIDAFPRNTRESYRKLWEDLRTHRTREATLVHQLDKVELILQASRYGDEVGRRKVSDFYASASKQISDRGLKRAMDSLIRNQM